MGTRAALVLVLFALGCGGGEAAPTDSCALSTILSGGVEQDVNFNDTDGCGGSYSDAERTRVLAYGGLGQLLLRVIVLDSDEDATGTFQGRVEVVDSSDQKWETADGECSVVITENEAVVGGRFPDARRIVATATCSANAAPDAANPQTQGVTIGPLEIYSCVLC